MSEEITSDTETVYIPLLDEGTIVFRPTPAVRIEGDTYKLLASNNYDSEDETWEFFPGSVVHCMVRESDKGEILVANQQVEE